MQTVLHVLAEIRSKAFELRETFGDDARARAIEWAAARIEAAVRAERDELISLPTVAKPSFRRRSGYCISGRAPRGLTIAEAGIRKALFPSSVGNDALRDR